MSALETVLKAKKKSAKKPKTTSTLLIKYKSLKYEPRTRMRGDVNVPSSVWPGTL